MNNSDVHTMSYDIFKDIHLTYYYQQDNFHIIVYTKLYYYAKEYIKRWTCYRSTYHQIIGTCEIRVLNNMGQDHKIVWNKATKYTRPHHSVL